MARKASAIVAPSLRIREDLRRRLEREAKRHGRSLNAEMTYRLERSFEADASRSNEIIALDLEDHWLRFSERFIALELEEKILTALENKEYDEAHTSAVALRRHQASAAKQRLERLERLATMEGEKK